MQTSRFPEDTHTFERENEAITWRKLYSKVQVEIHDIENYTVPYATDATQEDNDQNFHMIET